MLAKFAVTNYRSFEDRIELDLTKHKDYEFNAFAISHGIVKNGIIYGPNGSGKSNLGLAIFDIVNHLTQKFKLFDYYVNFAFAGGQKEPVKFEYTFVFEDDVVFYEYCKDLHGNLTSEKLLVNNNPVFDKRPGTFDLYDAAFALDAKVKDNIASSTNSFSIVNYLLSSFPLDKDHYLIKMQEFVNSMLWFRCLEDRKFIGLETNNTSIEAYIIKNKLVRDFQLFLEQVSGQKFVFLNPLPADKQLFCEIKGVRIPFDQIYSTGTSSLMLLYYWYKKMDEASFVFIDEFDAFYHFKLSYNVCKKLFDQNCQVFTSSHNTYLMTNELLRPDCNFVINNNKIKPLCDCTDKELRWGNNIEKLFRGGAFEI